MRPVLFHVNPRYGMQHAFLGSTCILKNRSPMTGFPQGGGVWLPSRCIRTGDRFHFHQFLEFLWAQLEAAMVDYGAFWHQSMCTGYLKGKELIVI